MPTCGYHPVDDDNSGLHSGSLQFLFSVVHLGYNANAVVSLSARER